MRREAHFVESLWFKGAWAGMRAQRASTIFLEISVVPALRR